jgi:primosomal protein N' (replication factor Y)
MPVGLGTERIEAELTRLFADYNIVRIDRDTTRKKGSLENLLEKAHNNTAHILVGTQMLAKGHHFSKLSLVAVVDADSGLYSTDFRALERLGQLLVQVAGRAGREQLAGEVIVQTHQPDHPMLQCLLQNGFSAFAKEISAQREAAQLPPYMHMALFRSEDQDEQKARDFLQQLKQRLLECASQHVQILGPIEAPMARRAGKFRAQLLLQSANRQQLQRCLATAMASAWLKRQKQKLRWSLDVDPVEFV